VHSLKHLCIGLKDKQKCLSLIETFLKSNVEYAEPDSSLGAMTTADSKIYSEADLKKLKKHYCCGRNPKRPCTITVEYYRYHINEVWNTYGTGNGSQTILILDTGRLQPSLICRLTFGQTQKN
jgi:hypothetical protein